MTQDIRPVPLDLIRPGPNDRTVFEALALRDLALSILEHGLLQPVTLRPIDGGEHQIVAGERRWRAHKLAREMLGRWQAEGEAPRVGGLYRFDVDGKTYASKVLEIESIPAIVRADLDDEQASALMLAENVARADLDPIDEAAAYQSRMESFGWDAPACAQQAGVNINRVRNRLKLLKLRPELQKLVRDGQLGVGYAQIIAEAHLDSNRQMVALRQLRDKKSPNPTWFRAVTNALMGEQAQETMWDMAQFMRAPVAQDLVEELARLPPHPNSTLPPVEGISTAEVIAGQARFWEDAGHAWGRRGEAHKRKECEAAATALSALLGGLAQSASAKPKRSRSASMMSPLLNPAS